MRRPCCNILGVCWWLMAVRPSFGQSTFAPLVRRRGKHFDHFEQEIGFPVADCSY